jgi:hypothetical protein
MRTNRDFAGTLTGDLAVERLLDRWQASGAPALEKATTVAREAAARSTRAR